jgi:hypothetical protein
VARSLEREWNEKLAEVEKLEREYALLPKQSALSLTAAQREHIRALAQDLPAIWHAPTTTFAQRKQLLRWLIKDVTLSKRGNVIEIAIRGPTEALTHLCIPRYKNSWELRQTSPQVVERVRQLSPTHTNAQIAAILTEEGERAGMGGALTVSKVEWIRYAYHIPAGCEDASKRRPHRTAGRWTLFGTCRRRPAQRGCLDDRRVVQDGATGECSFYPWGTGLDPAHPRDHRRPAQARQAALEARASEFTRKTLLARLPLCIKHL